MNVRMTIDNFSGIRWNSERFIGPCRNLCHWANIPVPEPYQATEPIWQLPSEKNSVWIVR